jgi:hypothetical protein
MINLSNLYSLCVAHSIDAIILKVNIFLSDSFDGSKPVVIVVICVSIL